MAQLLEVFGCRNPNATSLTDARQYMFWAQDEGHGVHLAEVVLDGQCDYMNTESIRSPIPSYKKYKDLLNLGWTPMTREELKVHFSNLTDDTRVGVPSKWNPAYMIMWCASKLDSLMGAGSH